NICRGVAISSLIAYVRRIETVHIQPSTTFSFSEKFIVQSRLPLIVSAVTAFAVVLPFFFLGIPSGHDFAFHMNSWMEVHNQWRQGIVYPRWADLAHFEYGEARFLFYPPASWMLGAVLGTFLPWKAVPGTFIWIVLSLSGICMYRLARRWLDEKDA